MVWISEVSLRRNPSLSASRIATSAHSDIDTIERIEIIRDLRLGAFDALVGIKGAEPQVANDLDALDGIDVGMHVAHADALLVQVFGEVLRHALGEHGDEGPVAALG